MNRFYNFNYGSMNVNFLYLKHCDDYDDVRVVHGQVIERITKSNLVFDIDSFELDFSTEITDPKEISRLNKLVIFK